MIGNVRDLVDVFVKNPIIAAARSKETLEKAIASPTKVVFLLFGSIGDLEEQCKRLREANKLYFLHVDLIDGLRPDAVGIKYIADHMMPTGIITTKGACIRMAHDAGLFAIQRVFLLDSSALRSGVQNVASCKPDLAEILPGVSDKALVIAKKQMPVPLIAGGLIYTKEDVVNALKSGVVAVSTSCEALWDQ